MSTPASIRTCALALALGLAGCYQPPSSEHTRLEISPAGELAFQGKAVERSALRAAIEAAAVNGRGLVVEIHASPQAPMALVEEAVAQAKAAHAVVSFGAASP